MGGELESINTLVGQYRREIFFGYYYTVEVPALIEARLTPHIQAHNARFAGHITFADISEIAHAKPHPLEWLLAVKEGEGR